MCDQVTAEEIIEDEMVCAAALLVEHYGRTLDELVECLRERVLKELAARAGF